MLNLHLQRHLCCKVQNLACSELPVHASFISVQIDSDVADLLEDICFVGLFQVPTPSDV